MFLHRTRIHVHRLATLTHSLAPLLAALLHSLLQASSEAPWRA